MISTKTHKVENKEYGVSFYSSKILIGHGKVKFKQSSGIEFQILNYDRWIRCARTWSQITYYTSMPLVRVDTYGERH